MVRRYCNAALRYALLAMGCGVFYREFTKWNGFTGKTNLSVMHAHYFLLGMMFFLVLMLLEKSFSFSREKNTARVAALYEVGLNITAACLFLRGLAQALEARLSRGMDASLSGVAGIGHTILAVSMVLLLLRVRKQTARSPAHSGR